MALTPKRSISRAISRLSGISMPPLETVVHVVLHGDGHAGLCRGLHHLAEAHAHEAHAVVERAAVFVAAVVRIGREELRNEVAVAGVHLHRVEARLVGRVDGASEVAGHLFDLLAPHAPHGGVGVEVESPRGADGYLPGGGQVGHVAAVADLDGGGSPFAVDGVGDVAQPRHDGRAQPQLLVERKSAARDGGVGQCGHADAAVRHGDVVLLELLRGAEVLAHRLEGSRTDRAVAQCHGSQLVGGEEFGIHRLECVGVSR